MREAIENYIYYYNHHRIKEKLNWKSPVEFRQFNQKNAYKIEWKNPLYKKSNFLGSLHNFVYFFYCAYENRRNGKYKTLLLYNMLRNIDYRIYKLSEFILRFEKIVREKETKNKKR